MKKLIFLFLISATTAFAGDKEQKVKSDIKEVTLFLNGAQVTSVGSTLINPGTTELVFDKLSPNINAVSIQAKGEGDFTILSVSFRTNYISENEKPKAVLAVEDSIETARQKLDMLNNALDVYVAEEEMVVANKSIGGYNTGVNSIEMEKMANFYRARLTDIKTKELEVNNKKKKLSEKIYKLSAQLNEMNVKVNRTAGEIVVTVLSQAAVNAKIELNYILCNAGWSPTYDIRATDDANPISIVYRANVYQNTGVDWNKVKLTLSTGNPNISGTQPTLTPWTLAYYYERPYKGNVYRSAPAPASVSYGEAAQAAEMMKQEESEAKNAAAVNNKAKLAVSSSNYTEVSENIVNTQFDISIPYDIASDGKQHAVEIQKFSLPAQFKYYCVPKLDKDAFLLARITGWEKLNMIPGNANIFYGDTYVGQSFLDTRSTNDTLDVSLGREKSIVVTREPLKDFMEKKIIGMNVKQTFTYEISMRNKKKKEIEIEVLDQIPLSSGNEIEVESLEISGASYEKESGKLLWKIKIPSSETKKVKLSYSVKYPKGKTINF